MLKTIIENHCYCSNPFVDQKLIQKDHNLWKDAYLNEKDNIERLKKNYVYNFIPTNEYDNEWKNLQSKLQEYTKVHETNGWEIFFHVDTHITTHKNIKH